jgi:aldose sugar dehydrogenase
MRSLPTLCAIGFAVVASASAAAQTIRSSAGDLAVQTIARGLDHPWGLAFLPGDRILVTERPGRMRIVAPDGKLSSPLAGVPRVFATSQGGLLDVVLDRGYADNHLIYCWSTKAARGSTR